MPEWLMVIATGLLVIIGVYEMIRRSRESVNASIKELAGEMRANNERLASEMNSLGQRLARLEGFMQGQQRHDLSRFSAAEGEATP